MNELDRVRLLRSDTGVDRAALERVRGELMSVIRDESRREATLPRQIVPQLAYDEIGPALEFLSRAFGFREIVENRFVLDDGTVGHAEMEAAPGVVFMLGQGGGHGLASPRALGQGTQFLTVHVQDVDAHFARARDAGARIEAACEDRFYGRAYEAVDPEGHRWMFLCPIETERETERGDHT